MSAQISHEIIESDFSDNFFFLIHDGERALVIDPVDAPSTIETVREASLDLQWVVNTHFHHDHIAGDDEVLSAFPDAKLAVADGDADTIAESVDAKIDLKLSGGDTLSVGDASIEIRDTPGHTPGHISLLIDNLLFCGDTVFVGGAGNCSFGGDAGVLFRTFRDVLSQLDDELLIFCGHDYSVRNLEFCLNIEPDNAVAGELLERARQSKGLFQTTLGTERSYNPFFRCSDDSLIGRLESEHPGTFATQLEQSEDRHEAAFRSVRALRNNW